MKRSQVYKANLPSHTYRSLRAAAPNILATGTSFVEDNFSPDGGMVQAVMQATGSDGE